MLDGEGSATDNSLAQLRHQMAAVWGQSFIFEFLSTSHNCARHLIPY